MGILAINLFAPELHNQLWEHAYFSTLCRGQLLMDGAFSYHPINAEFHVFYHELYNP